MALLYRMGTGNGSGGDLKPYTVNFECANGYIGQTLTMTYQGTPHAGEVVDNVSGTVGSDGTLTLYPMHSGNWECSCYSSVIGTTMTKTIDLSYWGIQPTVKFEDKPDGVTVTPTDDVQTWLHCANIWDKSYTTISEVVADTTILNTLISDNNAVDYLVRSTTWASDVCSNESAMIYIGLNDYCANKLLADSTWLTAICNSNYFEKVLNKSVPTLTTSNTGSDGGQCFASHSNNGNPAYYAFDKTSKEWFSSTNPNEANKSIGYIFPEPVCIKRLYNQNSDDGTHIIKTFNLQGSNDTTNGIDGKWTDITTINNDKPSTRRGETTYNITNNEYYKAYRIFITKTGYHTAVTELQFYGREGA